MTANASPACYGSACDQHQHCARYQRVEATEWLRTMLTCRRRDGSYPWFEAMPQQLQEPAPVDSEGGEAD